MIDWAAIALGVIEGTAEFLPISSTGYLLIAEHWLGGRSDLFNIVIQAGAIMAVTVIYWRPLMALLDWRGARNRAYLGKLAIAFLITAVLGFAARKLEFALPQTLAPVAWALIVGGFWMLAAEWFAALQPDRATVSWTVAIVVGVAQIIAGVFPGTSRSGATIFGAMVAGTSNRSAATEFAFLVGIPTMYAASVYELYGQLKQSCGQDED